MSKFIWLNRSHSIHPNRALFNIDNIAFITGGKSGTMLHFDNDNCITVNQTLEVVASLLGAEANNE